MVDQTDYGFTDKGFRLKTKADIIEEINADWRADFGEDFNLDSDSILGRIRDPVAKQLGLAWQGLQGAADAIDPDSAPGEFLNNWNRIRGVGNRKSGEYSTGVVTVSGDPGAFVESGSEFESSATGLVFVSTESAEIGSGGSVDIPVRSEEKGPFEASGGSIDTVVTGNGGITSVTNSNPVDPGQYRESDPDYRQRGERSVGANGRNTGAAIRGSLLQLKGVEAVLPLFNRTNEYDTALEMPMKSSKVVVYPDPTSIGNDIDETEVFETIWRKAPPLETVGSETANIEDNWGYEREVSYHPAQGIDIDVDVSITNTTSDLPDDADELIEDKIMDEASKLNPSDNVIHLFFLSRLTEIPGIIDGTVQIGKTSSGSTSDSNIPIEYDEIAVFSKTRITVSGV